MKIRFAAPEDIPAMVELGRRFHAMTRFKAYDYNAERVAANLRAVIDDPRDTHCFVVAEGADGKPSGGLIGRVERHVFSDWPVASVIYYGVLPERRMGGTGLKLLAAFRTWAENRGAYELFAGVNSGVAIDRTDRFLKRLGFHLTGGNYSLTLGASQETTARSS